MNKSRINVILPKNISKEMRERMLKDDYGLREKSRWVSEAIESFFKIRGLSCIGRIGEFS